MARDLLDATDLQELDRLYLEATRLIEEIRRHRLGVHVQKPKLPAPLTEGIAAIAAPLILGARAYRPSRGRSDLAVQRSDGSGERMLAVKGTGAARWITITETDLEAAALIWVDYAERAADGSAPVRVWVFEGDLHAWATTGRATLRQVRAAYRGEMRESTIRFAPAPRAWRISVCPPSVLAS